MAQLFIDMCLLLIYGGCLIGIVWILMGGEDAERL